ncbi:protein tyrosine phosphatase [Corynebacterium sp. 13CS0277]|uniref:low molecular weight protein-tyrosine-phosphatase n=1 Tax=Corynebacterium sp. 13CS0277 TaxID=2071994 RepID=UPI000D03BC83|nr:low molecular weight protein-tyrosine-phosphatase [Corynebacterium sp. 13CS0277]PRQ10720.1 protein tyrosine phosphatase [Corynebacterium sp. 13CS0277]
MSFSDSLSHAQDPRTESVYVVFVCTGNICRSPMADVMFADAIDDAGLSSQVRVASCGMGGWHVGQGADRRAVEQLARLGHDGTRHRAAQLGPEHEDANLFVAMDAGHVRELRAAGITKERIRLLRSFDPAAAPKAEVADPYYGGEEGFVEVGEQIAAALPGLVAWARAEVEDSSDR